MSTVLTVIATLAAGGLGAVLRALAVTRAPRSGTALVNLTGTLLLALVIVAHDAGRIGGAGALVLGVGLSGSLTTFSGWVALLADGFTERPLRTLILELVSPVIAAVGLVVLAFAVVA